MVSGNLSFLLFGTPLPRSSLPFTLGWCLFLRQSRPFPSLHELSSHRRKSPPIGLPRDSGVLLQVCLQGESGSCGFWPLPVMSRVRSCRCISVLPLGTRLCRLMGASRLLREQLVLWAASEKLGCWMHGSALFLLGGSRGLTFSSLSLLAERREDQ